MYTSHCRTLFNLSQAARAILIQASLIDTTHILARIDGALRYLSGYTLQFAAYKLQFASDASHRVAFRRG